MKYNFTKEELAKARPGREPLYGVVVRTMGPTPKQDETISISGLADEETYDLIQAVLRWAVKRDRAASDNLKKVVLALP